MLESVVISQIPGFGTENYRAMLAGYNLKLKTITFQNKSAKDGKKILAALKSTVTFTVDCCDRQVDQAWFTDFYQFC